MKPDRRILDERKAYTNLLHTCLEIDPKYDEIRYLSIGADFASLSGEVFEKIKEFKLQVSKTPLISLILLWASNIKQTMLFNSHHIEMMRDLIDHKLIPYQLAKTNKLLTLSDIEYWGSYPAGHNAIIEHIRCFKEWSFEKREEHVSFYIDFIQWLSEATFGYVPPAADMDRMRASGRLLKFETYIKIVSDLFLRERILAKIFYLGGSRSLEEVLGLNIEDIVVISDENIGITGVMLKIGKSLVEYPRHVLEDLKEYIGSRKKGYVFINREGEQIDPTVPYRALKLVTNKLCLDKSFTFKDFMKSA